MYTSSFYDTLQNYSASTFLLCIVYTDITFMRVTANHHPRLMLFSLWTSTRTWIAFVSWIAWLGTRTVTVNPQE